MFWVDKVYCINDFLFIICVNESIVAHTYYKLIL